MVGNLTRNQTIFILSSILLLLGLKSAAQSEFQHHYGVGANETCHDIHATSDGGFIMSGMTFQTNQSSNLGAILIKTDGNGIVEWTFAADSMSTTRYVSVVEDPSDQGFIAVTCTGNNWRSKTSGDLATWIFKVDLNGSLVWSKYIVGDKADFGINLKDRYDYFQSVRATSDGNFIALGRSELNSYTVTDPGLGSSDMIACKFSSSGTIIWTRAIGSTTYEYGFTVEQCADGDYIFYGYTGGKLSLTKVTPDGNTITWSNSYNMGNSSYIPGGQYSGWGSIYATNSSMIQTDDGGYVVVGYASTGSFGGQDFYVMKLKKGGAVSWAKRYGEAGDESASGVVQLADGNLMIAGTTRSTLLRDNDRDMLLIRLDSSDGSIIWCKSYNEDVTGVTEYETVTSIALKGTNSVVLGGAVDYNNDCGGMDMSLTLMNITGDLGCSASGALVMTDRTAVVKEAAVTPTIASVYVIEAVTSNLYNGGEYGSWVLDCNVELCSVVLPIKLISFEGENKGAYNQLTWSTASETNNDYFTVEKSTNAVSWTILETIPGAGNSNHILDYELKDHSPHPQLTYYRLKQTDFDGQFEYSQIIATKTTLDKINIGNLYPNPASDVFSFNHHQQEGNLHLKIYSTQGDLVQRHLYTILASSGKITVPISDLASGLYFVHFIGESYHEIRKMNVQND